jgi:biopolymer transport protein ExbB
MKNIVQKLTYTTLMMLPLTVMAAEEVATKVVKKETFIDVLKQGGFCMYPIGLCSIAMVWLVIDVLMRTNKKKMVPAQDLAIAQEAFRQGDYVGAYQAMKASSSPFADVVRYALGSIGYGKAATEEALIAGVEKINSKIQTRINYLSVIGVCTPMIGLLGTVAGMKGAFKSMGEGGAGADNAGEMAGHIGEVLIATASGLFIAIPAFMGYYFLRNKLQASIYQVEEEAEKLFRNAPYEYLLNADVGQEETYAALPNWVESGAEA